jgi:hypothetical protein
MTGDIQVLSLVDGGDERGVSLSIPVQHQSLIGTIRDVHIACIKPTYIRGNHYHGSRGELIAVIYRDRWSLHWDTGAGTARQKRTFDGSVLVSPPPNWSHAVRNDGAEDLWLYIASDGALVDDTIRRIVTD